MSPRAFVGRQPIVDRDRRVVAYELLYRSSRTAQVADFEQIESELARLRVSFEELQQFEHAAYTWLHALQQTLLA